MENGGYINVNDIEEQKVDPNQNIWHFIICMYSIVQG